MKKYLLTIIICSFLAINSFAQSVTIDPRNSAANIIDAKSTNQGIIVPKMTTAQKGAIANKTEVMLVYDTDLKQFSYWKESTTGLGTWQNMGAAGGGSNWNTAGSDISNANSGNVGIGTATPQAKLDLDGDYRFRTKVLNLTAVDYTIDVNTVKAGIYTMPNVADPFNSNFYGFSPGIDGRVFTLVNTSLYNIFIDTASPLAPANNRIEGPSGSIRPSGGVSFMYSGTKNKWLVISNTGDPYNEGWYTNDFLGNMYLRNENNKVGIGTSSPQEKLDVVGHIKLSGEIKPNGTSGLTNQVLTSDGAGAMSWTANQPNHWILGGLAGNEIKNTNAGGFWSENANYLGILTTDITNPPTAPVSGIGTRMMWIPSRAAFRVGTATNIDVWAPANIGLFSFASGFSCMASGRSSTAMGYGTDATGEASTAIGSFTEASGEASTAIGNFTKATGGASTAIGTNTEAIGNFSTAMGDGTIAAEESSTAMGRNTRAIGKYSTAMGSGTFADGKYAVSMGSQTSADGEASTSMGYSTFASGQASTAIGRYNTSNINGLFMVGNGNSEATRYTSFIIRSDNSRVGIGVENPIAHLHVGSYGPITSGLASYFYPGSTALTPAATSSANLGIYANQGIVSGTYIGAAQSVIASDIRIKNIINRTDNVADLDLLKKIQITNYRMKDQGTWGDKIFKKVIAQEVEKIYPEAVSKQTSVIPDIYALAEKVVYDEIKKELTASLLRNYDIKIGDKIKLIDDKKGENQVEVVAVSGNSFTVKDWNHATNKVFVFGREVNDFRSVDYEALSMLGISAIQQLAKEVEILTKENEILKMKNENFEANNKKTEARLDALEAMVKPSFSITKSNTKTQ